MTRSAASLIESKKSAIAWEDLREPYRASATQLVKRRMNGAGPTMPSLINVTYELDRELVIRASAIARNSDFLFYVILHAAGVLLLGRSNTAPAFTVGSPGRVQLPNESEGAGTILPIVTEVAQGLSGAGLLEAVRRSLNFAYEHQDCDAEEIYTALALAHRSGGGGLVELVLSYEPLHMKVWQIPDVESAASLFFHVSAEAEGYKINVAYRSDRYLQSEVDHYVWLFGQSLTQLLSGLGSPLTNMLAITTNEFELVTRDLNKTGIAMAMPSFQKAFEEQVLKTPDAPAVLYEGTCLTYAELNKAANRLARHLQKLGIGPDQMVGLCMERCPAMLVCILAVLKAGGAYLPLDPDHPADRLHYVLEETHTQVVLTHSRHKTVLPDELKIVELDDTSFQAGDMEDSNLLVSSTPMQLAYCLYTSGSTGRPKGVLVHHDGLANYLGWAKAAYNIGPDTISIVHSPLVFDLTVTSLLLPLVGGGCVSLLPAGAEIADLQAALEAQTCRHLLLKLTPTHLKALMPQNLTARADSPAVITLVVGGEDLTNDATRAWLQNAACRVFNEYGPTETVVGCIVLAAHDHPEYSALVSVPIGRPIANTQIFILDKDLAPVSRGIIGEIYIGGAGLARGYNHRPGMTAERFVPNPFGPAGTRLYRTGDVARYLPNGDIEYLGRSDDQVKIRGYRIELGEIETILREQEHVNDVVVIADRDENGEQRLLAYLVLDINRPFDLPRLESKLRQSLPGYMVPARFINVSQIPVTMNGKVDKNALPRPSLEATNSDTPYAAPRSSTETILTEIWAEVLNHDRIGIDDNFFDLGGHSLLATRVMFLIEKRTSVRLRVSELLRNPTIRSLATVFDAWHPGAVEPDNQNTIFSQEVASARRDAILPPDIMFQRSNANESQPAHIMLTGATGFVGRYLLSECLRQTQATITCLVRARDAQAGMQRVIDALAAIDRWKPDFKERFRVVAGDLAAPRFGLPETEYCLLAESIDAIVHNGASVNFFSPYNDLRSANVLSTTQIIRLAAAGRIKPLHHISSLSVFPRGLKSPTYFMETDSPPESPPNDSSGYALSKWAAEQLVHQAGLRGLPCTTYRLGLITADSLRGFCNPSDLVYRMVQAVVALQAEPQEEWPFRITPVDAAAEAIITLATRTKPSAQAFHIDGLQELSIRSFAECLRRHGKSIVQLASPDWHEALRFAAQTGGDPNLVALYSVFESGLNDGSDMNADGKDSSLRSWSADATVKRLAELGFSYDPLGEAHLSATLKYLDTIGF